jgi:hypothetical protein
MLEWAALASVLLALTTTWLFFAQKPLDARSGASHPQDTQTY